MARMDRPARAERHGRGVRVPRADTSRFRRTARDARGVDAARRPELLRATRDRDAAGSRDRAGDVRRRRLRGRRRGEPRESGRGPRDRRGLARRHRDPAVSWRSFLACADGLCARDARELRVRAPAWLRAARDGSRRARELERRRRLSQRGRSPDQLRERERRRVARHRPARACAPARAPDRRAGRGPAGMVRRGPRDAPRARSVVRRRPGRAFAIRHDDAAASR